MRSMMATPTRGGRFDDCVGATLTTTRTADILVTVAGTWYDATEVSVVGAECVIERNGTNISANPNFGTADADDTNGNNFEQALVITEIDSNRPAGTNTYNLACAEDAADFSINSLTTTVVALGS